MADKLTPAAKSRSDTLKFRSKKCYISLRFKLTFFVLLTIGSIMALTTWLTYQQQQRALRNEVVQRGATIARSLASSAAETVLNDLVCAALIHETMPDAQASILPNLTFESILHSLSNDVFEYTQMVPASQILRNAGVVEVLMVDTSKVVVAHNDIRKVSMKYRPPPGVKAYQGEDVLVQQYTTKSGAKRFDIAVPILVNRLGTQGGKYIGVVHLRMSQDWVEVTVKQAAYKLLIVMGAILLIGLMASMILANFITRPIKKLVNGVLAIASGNLDQKIKVGSNDELGELTSAFNQMTISLKEKELIKGAFSTYVSSQVMDEVLKDPRRMALGGARKRATMMFADIRGFTAMSETMEPEQVVSIINVYLSLQTEI
ncbi:HAMP domain-containing protein, partial [bacterium]|nr:HAMP domain-containing protein [bacterium]